MAIRSLTYLDIPVDIRREAAARSRGNLRALLVNPAYTNEQRQVIVSQIEKLSAWEAGTVLIDGVIPPPAAPAAPSFGRIRGGFS